MVVKKTRDVADDLQRGQALWSALPEGLRTAIWGGIVSAGMLWAGRVSHMQPVYLYAASACTFALGALVYARIQEAKRISKADVKEGLGRGDQGYSSTSALRLNADTAHAEARFHDNRLAEAKASSDAVKKANELDQLAQEVRGPSVTMIEVFRRSMNDEAQAIEHEAERLRNSVLGSSPTLADTDWERDARLLSELSIKWDNKEHKFCLSITNNAIEPIEGLQIWVDLPLIFSQQKGRFAPTRDFKDYQPVRLITGDRHLFHGQEETVRFLNYMSGTLYFEGQLDGSANSGKGVFSTIGLWGVPIRAVLGMAERTYSLCFSWTATNRIAPDPCDCPTENSDG